MTTTSHIIIPAHNYTHILTPRIQESKMTFTRSKAQRDRNDSINFYIRDCCDVLTYDLNKERQQNQNKTYKDGNFVCGSIAIPWQVKQYELWLRNLFYGEDNDTLWIANKNDYTFNESFDTPFFNRYYNKVINNFTVTITGPVIKEYCRTWVH